MTDERSFCNAALFLSIKFEFCKKVHYAGRDGVVDLFRVLMVLEEQSKDIYNLVVMGHGSL